MLIKTEDLAPKKIINFYVPMPMTEDGTCLLFFSAPYENDAFLRELFEGNAVTRCLIAGNLLSVQYATEHDKETLKALVLACIDEYITESRCFSDYKDMADLSEKCEAVADALIRPTLNRDKGDIIISVRHDVLLVKFTGHCAGCPYAQNTLQNVIVNTFKRYLPQIKDIRLKE